MSAMGPYAWCMQLALLTAARVPCASSARDTAPRRSNRDASVPSFILSLLVQFSPMSLHLLRLRLNHQCCWIRLYLLLKVVRWLPCHLLIRLLQQKSKLQWSGLPRMDLHNLHVLRLPEDLLVPLLCFNPMERCAVRLIILSIRHSHRRERNGSLRLVYAARIAHCRSCPLREQCQGHGSQTVKPRRVSAVFHPLLAQSPSQPVESVSASIELSSLSGEPLPASVEPSSLLGELPPPAIERSSQSVESVSATVEPSSLSGEPLPATVEPSSLLGEPPPPAIERSSQPVGSVSASIEPASVSAVLPSVELSAAPTSCPVLWEDWPARSIRRKWINLLRTETVLLSMGPALTEKIVDGAAQSMGTRAERAHWRMSWSQRLARNMRGATAPPLEITLHGLPASFVSALALDLAAA
jgi:hypothetical protein